MTSKSRRVRTENNESSVVLIRVPSFLTGMMTEMLGTNDTLLTFLSVFKQKGRKVQDVALATTRGKRLKATKIC